MTRSLKKGIFSEVLLQGVRDALPAIWSRRSMILPTHVHREVQVHTGKSFHRIRITQEMIGHRFGEFARTRKQAKHKGPKQKNMRGRR
jgi:small subunit ribosomal protein S19